MTGDQGQYIGRLLSLISKMKIRYEGRLASVNREEATLALGEVRSFGTENRLPDFQRMAPLDETFDMIVFRACDIEELTVLDETNSPYSDPAVVSIFGSITRRESSSMKSLSTSLMPQQKSLAAPILNKLMPVPMKGLSNSDGRYMQPLSAHANPIPMYVPGAHSQSRPNSDWRSNALPVLRYPSENFRSYQDFDVSRSVRRSSNRPTIIPEKQEYNTDFDFESNNARLKDVLTKIKEKAQDGQEISSDTSLNGDAGADRNDLEMSKTILGEIKPDHTKYYDKARSFFDLISTDVHQFPAIRNSVPPRLRNTETFGRAAVQHQYNLYMQRMQINQMRVQQYILNGGRMPMFNTNRFIHNGARLSMGGAPRFPPATGPSMPNNGSSMPSSRFNLTNSHF